MRLTSEIFVSALLRRVFASGGFGVVGRRGADQAGAVFIVTRSRDGRLTLYGPAPQASYDDARPGERAFMIALEDADQDALDVRLAREGRFDPDYWVVEIEAGAAPVGELIPLVTTP